MAGRTKYSSVVGNWLAGRSVLQSGLSGKRRVGWIQCCAMLGDGLAWLSVVYRARRRLGLAQCCILC